MTNFCVGLVSETKVILGVVVCDALNDLGELVEVCGILAVLYPSANEVTHNASEILVAGIGNEGAAVGEHTNEAGESAEVGKCSHLGNHTVSLIVEPPARAELYLTGCGCLLEVAEHSAEHVVILGFIIKIASLVNRRRRW